MYCINIVKWKKLRYEGSELNRKTCGAGKDRCDVRVSWRETNLGVDTGGSCRDPLSRCCIPSAVFKS